MQAAFSCVIALCFLAAWRGPRSLGRSCRVPLRVGVRRLVVMSSNSPFGANPTPDSVFDEDAPYNPYMSYGLSKYRMEKMLLEQMRTATLPEVTIIRAPWFYGPGQPERQDRFFSLIRQGRFPIFGKGENRRSMAFVENLAVGMILAAFAPVAANRAYWIADERPYSMVEIIGTVADVLSRDFGLAVSRPPPHLPRFIPDLARVADRALQAVGRYN